MGKRGPKAIPTAVRLFRGHPRAQKKPNPDEPVPVITDFVETPKWLGKHGKAEWLNIAPMLHAVGCLTDQDTSLLAQYCQAWDDFHNALADINKHGIKSVGSLGNDIINPAFKAKYQASALIVKIGCEFGLTPSSRVGMRAAPVDEGFDDLERFKSQVG